eukprot:CAMPEP_0178917934 /NCGR_PEP_ID=MMETSP0786-20121207/13540_1 /TAXON_ID=186022 /ORGANISM="Thalassionema frauenfeldii, Strain CCMP 1798" /LENGTH=306 /DNA_ID=CAMNT_0020591575 /DNA_START=144 /DNA_END=1064 /DNA_ORIENTATION=+
MDGMFLYPGQPAVPCSVLQQAGNDGRITPAQCEMLSGMIAESCQCQQQGQEQQRVGGCSVCGEGKVVGSRDSFFEYPGQPPVGCDVLEDAGYSGQITQAQCDMLEPLIGDCQCVEEGTEPRPPPLTPEPTPVPTPLPITPAPTQRSTPSPTPPPTSPRATPSPTNPRTPSPTPRATPSPTNPRTPSPTPPRATPSPTNPRTPSPTNPPRATPSPTNPRVTPTPPPTNPSATPPSPTNPPRTPAPTPPERITGQPIISDQSGDSRSMGMMGRGGKKKSEGKYFYKRGNKYYEEMDAYTSRKLLKKRL